MKITVHKFESTPDFYLPELQNYIKNYIEHSNVCPLNITITGRNYIGTVKKFNLDINNTVESVGQKIELIFLKLVSYTETEVIYSQIELEPVTDQQQLKLL